MRGCPGALPVSNPEARSEGKEVKMNTYIYGPVPSRRLGRSLGVDLVPLKTCTYDCMYCQLGRTTNKTTQRKEWTPLRDVLKELKTSLSCQPDYITISGSGEPTLHSGIGGFIRAVKAVTDIPVAVITNGSLLWLPEVREALRDADLVIPSLDAGAEYLFRHVNRPHKNISFHKMIDGLYEFRRSFPGRYWLEVFLVGGITGLAFPVEEIAAIVDLINPHRVHLNTVVRPPADPYIEAVPQDLMECYTEAFGKNAEAIVGPKDQHLSSCSNSTPQEVLSLISRRPCTLGDITAGLGLDRSKASMYLDQLSAAGLIEAERQGRLLYFRAILPASYRATGDEQEHASDRG
jgi:wyosine [tRNA(Phe)-imidazoG37] synthetase (radical SAM superfamily)